MKEELKKRRQKLKEEFASIKKQANSNSNSKKMSTSEKNKEILNMMTKKNEDDFEEVIEQVKVLSHKSFTCSCGCKVTLEGEARPLVEGKCSKCAQEILERGEIR